MNENPLTPDAIKILTRIGMQSDDILKRNMNLARDVSRAREAGASWRMISVPLGVSAQAAWQRFRPVDFLSARQVELPIVDVELPGLESDEAPRPRTAPGEESPPPENAGLRGARQPADEPHDLDEPDFGVCRDPGCCPPYEEWHDLADVGTFSLGETEE